MGMTAIACKDCQVQFAMDPRRGPGSKIQNRAAYRRDISALVSGFDLSIRNSRTFSDFILNIEFNRRVSKSPLIASRKAAHMFGCDKHQSRHHLISDIHAWLVCRQRGSMLAPVVALLQLAGMSVKDLKCLHKSPWDPGIA
jgi:hypothetical protein